jgi:hypothetical protein
MSQVTNIILIVDIIEPEVDDLPIAIKEINQWLTSKGHPIFASALGRHTDAYYGEKCLEATVFVGAFNFLHSEEFVQAVQKAGWRSPENLQLMLQKQDDDRFTLYEFQGKRLVPLNKSEW